MPIAEIQFHTYANESGRERGQITMDRHFCRTIAGGGPAAQEVLDIIVDQITRRIQREEAEWASEFYGGDEV